MLCSFGPRRHTLHTAFQLQTSKVLSCHANISSPFVLFIHLFVQANVQLQTDSTNKVCSWFCEVRAYNLHVYEYMWVCAHVELELTLWNEKIILW